MGWHAALWLKVWMSGCYSNVLASKNDEQFLQGSFGIQLVGSCKLFQLIKMLESWCIY